MGDQHGCRWRDRPGDISPAATARWGDGRPRAGRRTSFAEFVRRCSTRTIRALPSPARDLGARFPLPGKVWHRIFPVPWLLGRVTSSATDGETTRSPRTATAPADMSATSLILPVRCRRRSADEGGDRRRRDHRIGRRRDQFGDAPRLVRRLPTRPISRPAESINMPRSRRAERRVDPRRWFRRDRPTSPGRDRRPPSALATTAIAFARFRWRSARRCGRRPPRSCRPRRGAPRSRRVGWRSSPPCRRRRSSGTRRRRRWRPLLRPGATRARSRSVPWRREVPAGAGFFCGSVRGPPASASGFCGGRFGAGALPARPRKCR